MVATLDRRAFLATQPQDLQQRGWDHIDVLLVTGDAYADHASFPASLLGRILEAAGYRVGLIARPNLASAQDIARLGRPRLFAGVTAGALDSMVANYTALRKPRSDDPYAPDGKGGGRPDRAVTVYCNLLRQAFGKAVFVVIGGIEASLRRFAHYDYWSNRVRRSLLVDSGADLLLAGAAEETLLMLASRLERAGGSAPWVAAPDRMYADLMDLPGVTFRGHGEVDFSPAVTWLPSDQEVAASSQAHITAFNLQQDHVTGRLMQRQGALWVSASPIPSVSAGALESALELPFTRCMHPDYGGRKAPALEQVQFSVTSHRGCFGGCAFCAITALQGKQVVSRSRESILREIGRFVSHPEFRGTIPDLGGPTANMWGLGCTAPEPCLRPSCLTPSPCPHLNMDQRPYGNLLDEVASLPAVKHLFVTTGIRMDLALRDPKLLQELAFRFTSGNLKVAPEHVVPSVLKLMRKPSGDEFARFVSLHRRLSNQVGKRQYVLPYLMAAHPGCTLNDMVEAAVQLATLGITIEQCQIFTPTPGTAATVMYATGLDPETGKSIFVERSDRGKQLQKSLLLYHLPEERSNVLAALKQSKRLDAADVLWKANKPKPGSGGPGRH